MHPFEAIFYRYKPMATRLEFLSAIVQNDIPLTHEDRQEWWKEVNRFRDDLNSLVQDTDAAVCKNIRGENNV